MDFSLWGKSLQQFDFCFSITFSVALLAGRCVYCYCIFINDSCFNIKRKHNEEIIGVVTSLKTDLFGNFGSMMEL